MLIKVRHSFIALYYFYQEVDLLPFQLQVISMIFHLIKKGNKIGNGAALGNIMVLKTGV